MRWAADQRTRYLHNNETNVIIIKWSVVAKSENVTRSNFCLHNCTLFRTVAACPKQHESTSLQSAQLKWDFQTAYSSSLSAFEWGLNSVKKSSPITLP